MNRNLLFLLLLFAMGKVPMAQTSSFSFSSSPHATTGWINVAGDPLTAVRTAIDSATGFQISSVSIANWYSTNSCAQDNVGVQNGTFFPASVMVNTWRQYGPNGATNSQYNAALPQLIVSGLNKNALYTFRMTGSLGVYIGTYHDNSRYTVTGAVVNGPVYLNADSNAANGVTFRNVAPDSTGKVRIYVNTYDSAGIASINGVQIITGQTTTFWSTTGNTATGGDTNFVGTTDTNRLAFRTNNIERMTIRGDGTIGIGTKNTFGYALAVNGSGIFTAVWVKPYGNWPDYVFQKGYSLPSLDSLSAYIRTYSHLPGIPSADNVQRAGIDVGGTQAALLKKIEELTLYIIDQDKTLQEYKRKLSEQDSRAATLEERVQRLEKLLKQ